jgi:hypothetical protein
MRTDDRIIREGLHAFRVRSIPVPAFPSSIIEPLWDQVAALLPDHPNAHPLGCHRPRIPDRLVFDKLVQVLSRLPHAGAADLDLPAPQFSAAVDDPFPAQLDAVLDANVPVFSFTLGMPNGDAFTRLKEHGIIIGTATTVAEARLLASAGCDAVVAQGAEADAAATRAGPIAHR